MSHAATHASSIDRCVILLHASCLEQMPSLALVLENAFCISKWVLGVLAVALRPANDLFEIGPHVQEISTSCEGPLHVTTAIERDGFVVVRLHLIHEANVVLGTPWVISCRHGHNLSAR